MTINLVEAQEALIAAMLADPALQALVGADIYNHVPQGTEYPYLGVQFASMTLAPPKNGGIAYQAQIRIDASSTYRGDAENLMIGDALVALLHHADLAASTVSFDCLLFDSVQYARGQDGVTHLASFVFTTFLTPTP